MQNSLLSGTFRVLPLSGTLGPEPFPVKASGWPCVAKSYDVLPPFPHIESKTDRYLMAMPLMKLPMSTSLSSTSESSFGSVFAASASL